MIYRLYCSSGNTVGVDEYVSYSEIEASGHWLRYVEIKADGTALRYGAGHSADEFGALPEGKWEEAEATRPKYGVVRAISKRLFEAVWTATRASNESASG